MINLVNSQNMISADFGHGNNFLQQFGLTAAVEQMFWFAWDGFSLEGCAVQYPGT